MANLYRKSNWYRVLYVTLENGTEIELNSIIVYDKNGIIVKNEYGYYQIQVQDKELYNYTQKLLRDIFRLRITDINKDTRIVTAEGDHKGVLLRVIDILRDKYTFSVVLEKKK